MTIVSIIVLCLELLSLFILAVGLLSYRSIVKSHRMLLASLHQKDQRGEGAVLRVLGWSYILLTLFVTILSVAIFWQLF